MKRKDIDTWLRNEAEKLGKERDELEEKIKNIMKKEDTNSIDKINKYYTKLKELQVSQFKLYEMIGRIDEIENITDIEN